MGKGKNSLFVPNPVPSISEGHLERVKGIRKELAGLMALAYPDVYQEGPDGQLLYQPPPSFKIKPQRPKLRMPVEELEGRVGVILDGPTVDFLISEEAKVRPQLEQRGLQVVFQSILPALTEGYNGSAMVQYKAVVDAQCVACMKKGRFRPLAGFIRGAEYELGGPVPLENLVSGGWKKAVVTDADLAIDDGLRERLTPGCEEHGKDKVFQLAVVHEVLIVDEKGVVVPGSPILEARLKTSFEYLWKLVKFYEGQREGVTDSFAARVRVTDDRELALALVRVMMASPQINWYRAIVPQNFDNFNAWMSQQLERADGEAGYFRSHIYQNACQEDKPLVMVRNGVEMPARCIELFRPFGRGHSTQNLNAVDVLFYRDDEYTAMLGTKHDESGSNKQNRMGYQLRREDIRRETSTAGEWVIAQRLAGISLDPSSVAYNRLVAERRASEMKKEEEDARIKLEQAKCGSAVMAAKR